MAGIRERIVQLTVRAREFLSGDLKPATDAMRGLSEEGRRLKDSLAEAGRARGLLRALRDSEGATGSLERTWRDAQATLDDLTREIGENEKATAGQRIALREARRTVDEAEAAYKRSQRGIKNLRTELKALGVDADNLGSEEDRLTSEIEQNKRALDENRDAIKRKREEEKKAADAAQEHASSIESVRTGVATAAVSFGKWLVSIYLVEKALQGLGAGVSYLKDGIVTMLQTGDLFEGLQTRMNALMGSVAAGEAATAWIKEFARDTPLELKDVTDAFAMLQAYGVDPMNGTLQALVDQNEKLGGGMERLSGLISAVGQAYAKQKLQTEEILQLVERGVPVWDLLSKVTGKNAAQLQDLASKGKLGRDVLAALVKEIGRLSAGAAESNMDRLSGMLSTLKDQATDFYSRIANAGALEYVKAQLKELIDTVDQMASDGRLDALAKALSDTFVLGAKKLKELVSGLRDVDFAGLASRAEEAGGRIGETVDQAVVAGKVAVATLTTVWNGFSALVTSAAATVVKAVQLTVGSAALGAGQIAGFFGNKEMQTKAEGLYTFLGELSAGYVAQAKTDLAQMAGAWDFLNEKTKQNAQEQTDAAAQSAAERAALDKALTDQEVTNRERARQASVDAAAQGRQAIESLAQSLDLISTASTVQQLEGLRAALLSAYQAGKLSQEEYAQATGVLSGRLKELGSSAGGASALVSDLEEKLGDLASVQAAISNAKTDVDINAIKKALRELYDGGKISATQYNQELKKTTDRQKELRAAVTDGAKAQGEKNKADKEAIVTSEQLRRESGKRMEAERQAGDEAMQRRRKESSDAKQDMGAMGEFFSGVMTRVREPLAQMSAAALEAFNHLRGISSVEVGIDTSDLEATTASLQRVRSALGDVQHALANPLMSSLGRWAAETQQASLKTQQAYLEQKAGLQGLMDSYSRGNLTLSQFIAQASTARRTMNLLDASDLSSLESAIQSARQQMQQMAESTRSTLESLQDELDGLQGREEAIERRRFEARRRDLQVQLAEAKSTGSADAIRNALRSISILREVEAATEQQRQRAEQEKRIEASKQAPASQPAPRQAPSRVVRFEGRNRTVDVAVRDEADEAALLGLLEDAAGRAL